MTRRLYYHDSYLTRFTARIISARSAGERPAAVLDATAFYPEAGGQPHDTGVLGGVRVVDVLEDESGAILHVLDSPLQAESVEGCIDWQRRFDHMQQHTGQHILSQAFLQAAGAATVSFHLGTETSTIDLVLSNPAPEVMLRAEEIAARVVFEDRPVSVLFVDKQDLGLLGLRKDPQREGEIRVIDVEDFDRSPCGGTHVRRTGEIGMISILGCERYKGGTRVEFVCGGRVLRCFRRDHATLEQLAKSMSAHPQDLPRLFEKTLEERAELNRENVRLKLQLLEVEAGQLLAGAPQTGGVTVICRQFEGRSIDEVKLLAQKICVEPRAVAILAVPLDACQVVVARGTAVSADCGTAIRQVAARLGGRGGGRPELAQAGGIAPTSLQAWLRELRGLLAGPEEEKERAGE